MDMTLSAIFKIKFNKVPTVVRKKERIQILHRLIMDLALKVPRPARLDLHESGTIG
jgi:hypothetical protein